MSEEPLDGIDREILRRLQRDGRIQNTKLADGVGLSPSPCLRRVRRLEEERYVQGYAARVDPTKLGWGVVSFVSLNVGRDVARDVEGFAQAVRRMPQVISCHALAGNIDYLLEVVARDLDDYYELMMALGRIPGIKDIHSSIAIKEVKPARGYPIPAP